MIIFRLPDLGEGLAEAVIREWYVKVGDTVTVDQPLVSMETAKAVLDVPSPIAGKIEKLFGNDGDTIETGHPLMGFAGEGEIASKHTDKGTVVGAIEETGHVIKESAVGISTEKFSGERAKATPAVRALAKRLGVNLNEIQVSGERINAEDVERAAAQLKTAGNVGKDWEKLSQLRQAMVLSMNQSHREVVPVTIVDDADIHAWKPGVDVTIQMMRAIAKACEAEPKLNAFFNSQNSSFKLNKNINLGVAVDTSEGLFVPVVKDVAHLSDEALRTKINEFKTKAQEKKFHPDDLRDATITLSNFGVFAGRYASPIIVPPMVAIIAMGRLRREGVAVGDKIEIHRILPLSLTFDHRLVTGGEAARFLKILIEQLQSG